MVLSTTSYLQELLWLNLTRLCHEQDTPDTLLHNEESTQKPPEASLHFSGSKSCYINVLLNWGFATQQVKQLPNRTVFTLFSWGQLIDRSRLGFSGGGDEKKRRLMKGFHIESVKKCCRNELKSLYRSKAFIRSEYVTPCQIESVTALLSTKLHWKCRLNALLAYFCFVKLRVKFPGCRCKKIIGCKIWDYHGINLQLSWFGFWTSACLQKESVILSLML